MYAAVWLESVERNAIVLTTEEGYVCLQWGMGAGEGANASEARVIPITLVPDDTVSPRAVRQWFEAQYGECREDENVSAEFQS